MNFIKVTLFSIVFTVISLANIANAGLIIAGSGLSATDFNESNATFSDLNNTNLLVGTNYTFADVGTINGFSNHPTGQWLYQNGGTNGYIEIATIGGVDLTGLEFNVANGWDTPVTQYIWLQTFSDGAATGYNFDVTSFSGNLLTLIEDKGTTF